ncbi:hypothetical protein LCGC14_0613850 [marine sediment metagenome]|uniref:Uncharacterized protein n=1 Tax=marine sediment metagenome TaxID=412755 RepID=A0A0F9R6Z8_9ZZZZ
MHFIYDDDDFDKVFKGLERLDLGDIVVARVREAGDFWPVMEVVENTEEGMSKGLKIMGLFPDKIDAVEYAVKIDRRSKLQKTIH